MAAVWLPHGIVQSLSRSPAAMTRARAYVRGRLSRPGGVKAVPASFLGLLSSCLISYPSLRLQYPTRVLSYHIMPLSLSDDPCRVSFSAFCQNDPVSRSFVPDIRPQGISNRISRYTPSNSRLSVRFQPASFPHQGPQRILENKRGLSPIGPRSPPQGLHAIPIQDSRQRS